MSKNSVSGFVGEGGDFIAAFRAMNYGGSLVEKKLPAAKPVPAIPARAGASAPVALSSSGGGIASPLTETAYADRTWWASRTTSTPDGLLQEAWAPLKTLKMTDANSDVVDFGFADAPP